MPRLGQPLRESPGTLRFVGLATKLLCTSSDREGSFVRPNVRAKRATTAGRQARTGENVPRTARPGLVACRWRSA